MLYTNSNQSIKTEQILRDVISNDYSTNLLKIQLKTFFKKSKILHNNLDERYMLTGRFQRVPVYFNYQKNIWTIKNNDVQCLFIDNILMPGTGSTITKIDIDRKIAGYIKKIKKGDILENYFKNVLDNRDNIICFQDHIQTKEFKDLDLLHLKYYLDKINEKGLQKSLINLCTNPYLVRDINNVTVSYFLDSTYAKANETYVSLATLSKHYDNHLIDGIIIDISKINKKGITEIVEKETLRYTDMPILFTCSDEDELSQTKILNVLKVCLLSIKSDRRNVLTNFIKKIINQVIFNQYKVMKYDDNDLLSFACVYLRKD